MKEVRRKLTREQFDDLLKSENKSSWLCNNDIVSTDEFCGYGFYGFAGVGKGPDKDYPYYEDDDYWVEYYIGTSCD